MHEVGVHDAIAQAFKGVKNKSEITDAVEAILETYRSERAAGEKFIDTLHRLGLDPFKVAANAQRIATARDHTSAA